jgi:hypothetical protein
MRAWLGGALSICLLTLSASSARAGQNDFVLTRFASFERGDDCPGNQLCGSAQPKPELFRDLVRDFGQVMAPPLVSPAETLGQAGFALHFVPSMAIIPSDENHWTRAVRGNTVRDGRIISGGKPNSVLFTPHLVARKGLPFSFEVAGTLGHVAGSDMATVGAEIKWALNEGFHLFPDVAVRGTVNTLVGSRDLRMITAGWDFSISKSFPIGGVMSIAPYAGYQQLHVVGWSRLLNVRPQDPRAPRRDNPDTPENEAFNPEFVFDTYNDAINRGFVGGRFNVWLMTFSLEAVIGESVTQLSLSTGMDF